jgi:DNA-binding LytR/AlgR family response regulator
MKALIVDDEPIARQVLREQLEEFPEVLVAGEAASGLEALEKTARLAPDLLFLDLQMPELDGLAVAQALPAGEAPLIIYVTAYKTHALDAFDTGAVDYLLKPVRRERLAAALDKARAQLAGRKSAAAPPAADAPWRIIGHLGRDFHLIDPADVIAFHAEDDVVSIISLNGRFYASDTLKTLGQRLPAARFRRVHRSTIVNTDHIRKVSPLSSKRWLLKMSNGLEVVVSKRMAATLRETGGW